MTLMLTDPVSVRMSVKLHMIWAIIYVIVFASEFDVMLTLILFVMGVAATYGLLNRWNYATAEIAVRKPEFRKFVRPNDMADVALVNKYRIPFVLLFWVPLVMSVCIFGKGMAEEAGVTALLLGLLMAQLVLFDFINVEIRTRILLSSKP